ncbi:MAG: NADH-quinone oxidoreductase subunit N [Chloroflexi bacterium]|nr:NADH-quinone oxidoreductase subunit N [Chloroflexota bacterium]
MYDLRLMAPQLALMVVAFAVLFLDLLIPQKQRWMLAWLSVAGLVVAAGLSLSLLGQGGTSFFNMLVVDGLTVFFMLLFAGAALLVVAATAEYAPRLEPHLGEYYSILLLTTAAMMFLASSGEFISLYVALETIGIGLYVLAGLGRDQKSSEAGIKYLLLGAISSAVLLYGMALVYGLTGSTDFAVIAQALPAVAEVNRATLLLAVVLLVAGFGFKMAAVPFQMWVPDVYEGAPTPVTMYLSVASKAAGFAAVLRVFHGALGQPPIQAEWAALFAVLAVASMTVGNVGAIPQSNIKRMMGYSSIAHAGYLMVGLAVLQQSGSAGLLFYLVAYALTNLAAFLAIILISRQLNSDLIPDYTGLYRRAPALALVLGLCMLSLTGIPPTAGFWAKVYLFGAAVESGLAWLALVGVINSVVSAYYYIGVVRAMFLGAPASEEPLAVPVGLRSVGVLVALVVLAIGVYPPPFLDAAVAAARVLVP